jgi:glycosyltransferase involved in cell wall biosynthesis
MPVFSIITPVYNGENFISRCYSNLLDQVYTNWEWVIVNDGSTDNTLKIIQGIKDHRIKLITYDCNMGRGYARNLAVENSNGDWIVCFDIDDLHFPNKLDIISKIIDKGYDYFCSYALLINNDLQVKGLRGFSQPNGLFPRGFVHPTLACKRSILNEIKYTITKGKGAPAEDARVIWILSLLYNGYWYQDTLTLYQEDREINVSKAIYSNKGHLYTIIQLKKEGYFKFNIVYIKTIIYYLTKIKILELISILPFLYYKTIKYRSMGQKNDQWKLKKEYKNYLSKLSITVLDKSF